ncbi:MAG: hypothetical protein EXR71_05035 [Myxococcales bacterium]|nr:hypothetical protein [Myxococcales bacterium]
MQEHPEGSPDPLPGTVVESFRVQSPVTTAERAWKMVGDTDFMNRAAGNGAVVKLDVARQTDGFMMLTGVMAAPMGMRIPFEETWTSWVHQRFFRQVRDLTSPFVARSDYRASLVPAPGGVRAVVDLSLTGPGWAAMVRRGLSLTTMQRRWETVLQRLGDEAADEDGTAARVLGAEAQAAVRRWKDGADPAMVARLESHYRCGRPSDLSRMRAFVLADRWGLPREALLETLLAGVDVGATELFWSVRCVRCYGQVAGGRVLSDLADHAECPACAVTTETDLGENVEVLFAPHPGVMRDLDVNFCTIYPAQAPAQYALLTLAPKQGVVLDAPVPPGEWRIGPGGGQPDVVVDAGGEGVPVIRWRSGDVGTAQVRAGDVTLDIKNDTARRGRVQLTRSGGEVAIVPASYLTTRENFRRRLGHQVLARDLRVGVRSVALLFTDLSGSTMMYEELGDARAFAVVRDHFVILRAAAAAQGGTVVKTIGDAVMAAFFDAAAAVAAACQMQAQFTAWASTLKMDNPPSLKVGVHVGSALVVHSDAAGLDYFGGTVNLAARAQGAAAAGEVVLTDAVAQQERVVTLLAELGVVPESFHTPLKGLGEVRLWRVRGPLTQKLVPASA